MQGDLDRALEFLPDDEELDQRAASGHGLTSPELSVLLAYAKITNTAQLLQSDLAEASWFERVLRAYFPDQLVKRYGNQLHDHPLRREIITTFVVNDMINRGGITFSFRAQEATGASPDQIAGRPDQLEVAALDRRRHLVRCVPGHPNPFTSGFATTSGNRPVYAAVVLDAINVKVRDGQVANRPVYAAIGVDLEGHKDILGMWFGDGGGESAKFWMAALTELRNRGVADVFFLVCDGLKGLPDSVNAVWPATIVQTSSVHHEVAGESRWSPAPFG